MPNSVYKVACGYDATDTIESLLQRCFSAVSSHFVRKEWNDQDTS